MDKPTTLLRHLDKPKYVHIVANGESWLFLASGDATRVWAETRLAGYDLVAGDIAGGIAVTMPSERELENPEIGEYVSKFLKSSASANKRMRMVKFLQNWVAGLHVVGTYQGAGPSQNQRSVLYRITDLEEKKRMADELANKYI